MVVHVMPSFYCKENCSYCYLGDLRKDSSILSSVVLYEQLTRISDMFNIESIRLYGGEITELPLRTLSSFVDICLSFCDDISFISNLAHYEKLLSLNCRVSTSLTPGRTDLQRVKTVCETFGPLDITVVITPDMNEDRLQDYLSYANSLSFLRYSPSLRNPLWPTWKTDHYYEEFLLSVLPKLQVPITNREELRSCIEGTYNSFVDSALFIVPNGDICTIGYKNDLEFFRPLKNLTELIDLINQETDELLEHGCSSCEFFGHCYVEHIHFRKGVSCCGCKKLLRWYQESLYQDDQLVQPKM